MLNKNKILKKIMLYLCISILIFLIGCAPKKDSPTAKQDFDGTQGIVMNFLPNSPPATMNADADNFEIPIIIEVRNLGTYPTEETPKEKNFWDTSKNDDLIFISGYDKKIIKKWEIDEKSVGDNEIPKILLKDKDLDGKNTFNPIGGYDTIEFVGQLDTRALKIDGYNPVFKVTACYDYVTKANPTVCIDPDPYSLTKDRVCDVSSIALTSQGAPIAITRVEQEVLRNTYLFKIYFKNVGGGDVIATDKLQRCGPDIEEDLDRKDFDLIKISSIKVSDQDIEDSCKPVISIGGDKSYFRLLNGEGFIVCSVSKTLLDPNIKTAYTTPLFIEVLYGYRSSISKTVQIKKIPTG